MKKHNKKEAIILLILLPVFLWLSMNFTTSGQEMQKPYSIFNKEKNGVSVFYDVFKELGYPVKFIASDIVQNENTVQIAVLPGKSSTFDLNDNSLKDWIEEGGNLVYLTDKYNQVNLNYGIKTETYHKVTKQLASVHSYGEGIIIIGDAELITNETLTEDTEGAYWLLSKIDKLEYEYIGFNEFYHYKDAAKPSLWKDMPSGIKVVLLQIAFFIFIIIFYKGKRFGKPIPLYEEVERTENEFIYAVAALYKKGKCKEIVLQSFYESFLLKASAYFGKDIDAVRNDIVELWEYEQLSELSKMKKVHDFIFSEKNDRKSISSKKMIDIVLMIEQLNNILEKRREAHWITLKKDIQGN